MSICSNLSFIQNYKKINYKYIVKDKNFYKEQFCNQRENICKTLILTKKNIDNNIKEFTNLKNNTSGTIKDYINEKKNKFFVVKEKMDDLINVANNEFRCLTLEKKILIKIVIILQRTHQMNLLMKICSVELLVGI